MSDDAFYRDAVAGIIWAALTAVLAWSLWRTSGRLFPGESVRLRALHATVLGWGCVTAGAFAAGLTGRLGAAALASSVAFAAGVLHVSTAALTPSLARLPRKRRPTGLAATILWIAAAALLGGASLGQGVLEYPRDWDTLMYHLPMVDSWLQAGSLGTQANAVWYNASGLEALALWLTAPFSGDFFAQLVNLPVMFVMAAGAWELTRLLGGAPPLRHAAAAAIVTSDVAFKQLTCLKNDFAVATLLVVGLVYGLRYCRRLRGGDLLLASTALGLLCGVKYYGLGYAAAAWFVLLPLAWRSGGRAAALRLAGGAAAGTATLAGYWYARNFALTGTPVYPLGIAPGTGLPQGMRENTWESTLLGNGNPDLLPQWTAAVQSYGGPLIYAAVLLLPLTSLWLAGGDLLRPRPSPGTTRRGRERLAAAVLGVGALAAFSITPYATDADSAGTLVNSAYLVVRFSLSTLTLATIGLAVAASDLGQRLGRLRAIGSVAAAVPTLAFASAAAVPAVRRLLDHEAAAWETLLLAANAVLLAICLAMASELVRRRRTFVAATVVALCLAAGAGSYALSRPWHAGFAEHYDRMFGAKLFSRLEGETPRPERVVTAVYRYYPFFGSARQIRTYRPTKLLSERQMLEYVATHEADLFAVVVIEELTNGRFHGAYDWTAANPEVFSYYDRAWNYEVFCVDRAALARRLREFGTSDGAGR
ncbi:hypothetical protein CA12_33100 [Alienimonas californiensis]|uniref:Glycosyltransferase RgtA/B/C/D-like domain-containing protein n=1 Tax=Alienimonas californiensis TaxID=2527989 RepID=A0A517PCT8_9PLAN|nr:hypothetical protein CA12_33100 [Alienimonas californiensis]